MDELAGRGDNAVAETAIEESALVENAGGAERHRAGFSGEEVVIFVETLEREGAGAVLVDVDMSDTGLLTSGAVAV